MKVADRGWRKPKAGRCAHRTPSLQPGRAAAPKEACEKMVRRTQRSMTISEAHPYHGISEQGRESLLRGGSAEVRKQHDEKCPKCRAERKQSLERSASHAAQETVRSHFARERSVQLTFTKEGQRAVSMVAKTEQILSGRYSEMIDRNAAKGFQVTVSGAEQAQKPVNQQEQAQATGLGFGF